MICPHNDHVICDGARSCRRCGWDPEEHRRRVEILSTRGTVFGRNNLGRNVPGEEQNGIIKMVNGGLNLCPLN